MAYNALKHGLLTRHMLTLDERARGMLKLWRGLYNEFQPVGFMENLLVERITFDLWRMRRLNRTEADVLALREGDGRSQYRYGQAFLGDCFMGQAMPRLSRCEVARERSLYRALESLRKAQEARKGDKFDGKSDKFDAVREGFSGRPNGAQVPPPQANGAG